MTRDSDFRDPSKRYITVTVSVTETDTQGRAVPNTYVAHRTVSTVDLRAIEQHGKAVLEAETDRALSHSTLKGVLREIRTRFVDKVTL